MSVSESLENGGDCIKIFLRVRPSFSDHNHTCLDVNSGTEITLKGQNPKVFEFDHVADENTTQETVFSRVGRQIVESCVEGYNGTIFAYGQTGSGKTHTMLGPSEDNVGNCEHHLRGVIPRSLEYLFELIKRKQQLHGKQFEFECRASFLEIYNEQIYDLMDQCGTRPLQLRESTNRGVFVEGVTERSVASSHEACNVLAEGWCYRRVASTSMNRESSRSHAVFTLTVEMKEQTASGTKVRQSVLNLVDLAGSERQRDTQASGTQLREAGKINGSLSVLGQVIMALDDIAHNKTRHVPYRNSKLTFLLRDSLGGNAKTHIIINVHPNMQYFGETTSTLLFAQRAKQIKNRARVNENLQGDVTQLQNEIKRLKAELALYEEGTVSKPVRKHGAENGDISIQADLEFRDKFFQAMQMLEKQGKVVSSLKKQIVRMDQTNMSKKFIIKLRNSTIESLKNGKNVTKDEEVEALKKEIEILKEQVDHHPEIATYQTKITELQNEVEQLQEIVGREAVQNREKSLNVLFLQLVEELEPDLSLLKKDTTFGESSLLSATLNNADKSKIAEMEEKLRLKTEEVQKLSEMKSKLEDDLSSTRNNIQDLEAMLKNTREESSLHMRTLNRMHESTLRTITTPVKGRPNRDNSSGPSPAKQARVDSIPIGNLIDISFPGDEELRDVPSLLDQSMPKVMEDVLQEALQDELRQVKEQMETFREESLSKDNELAALRQAMNQSKERLAKHTQSLNELKENHSKLQKECVDVTSNKQIALEEVRDLKILLTSADRELAETKKKYEAFVESLKLRLNKQESDFFALQESFGKLDDEREKAIMDSQTLSADCEKQKIELGFMKKQINDLSESLQDEKKKFVAKNAELQDAADALKREVANSDTLRRQLEGKTKEVSEEISILRSRNCELEKNQMTIEELVKQRETELHLKTIELEEISKRKKEADAAVKAFTVQVSELRGSNSMLEIANSGLHAEFDELMLKFDQSVSDLDRERGAVKELEEKLKKEREEFTVKQEKHEFELESLQEDVSGYAEQYEALEKSWKDDAIELENTKKRILELQQELGKLQKAERFARDLEDQLSKTSLKYTSCKEKLSELEEKLTEAEKSEETLIQLHSSKIAQLEEQIEERYQHQNARSTENLRRELEEVKFKAKQATDQAELLSQQVEERVRHLESLKLELEEYKQNETSIREEMEKAKSLAEKLSKDFQPVQTELDEARQLKIHAEEELERVKQEKQELLTENAHLAGHANHNQKIQYLLKIKNRMLVLEEENAKLKVDLLKVDTELRKHDSSKRKSGGNRSRSKDVCPLSQQDLNKD